MKNESLKSLSVFAIVLLSMGHAALAADAESAPTQPASPQPLTLQDAQARAAAASKAAELAKLNATAARYHRQAAQADYFPKIGSTFYNLHFNKFMGQRIPVADRTLSLPLLNKDQSLFAVTVTQPVTPLFKVNQAVRIARADERAAQAKADAAAAALAAAVQNAYFALLIAQRQQVVAEAKVKMLEGAVRLAGSALPPMIGSLLDRQTALTEAGKALITVNSKAAESSRSLSLLIGLHPDTQLELAIPEPLGEETQIVTQASAAAIERNPEVVEAREGVEKARAAARLAKLDYVPDIAGLWGYSYQTAVPLLPRDFSFVGFVVSWNVFDFGKRERTVSEWKTKIRMAEVNLELVRGKIAAGAQRASLDVQRTGRILELTRRVASMQQMSADPASNPDARAARAQAEAETFQADLDFRLACADFKRITGGR